MKPQITHLRVKGHGRWRARVIQPDELPPMERQTTGQGGELWFRHKLGAKKVTFQGTVGGSLDFLPDCTCRGVCTKYRHGTTATLAFHIGEFREDVTLPRQTGMLRISMYSGSVWSVTILDY